MKAIKSAAQLVKNILRGSFGKSVSKLVLGSGLAQLLSITFVVLLSRIYSPEDFGGLALVVSISVLLSVVVSGRYEMAVMNPPNQTESADIIVSAMCLSVLFCGLFLAILIIVVKLFYAISPEVLALYVTVPIVALFQSWYSAAQKWSNRMHGYFGMSLAVVVVAAVGNGGGLLLAAMIPNPGALELVASFAAGQISGIIVLFSCNGRNLLLAIRNFRWKQLSVVLRTYWRFPAFTLPQSLASKAVTEMPVFFLTVFFGASTAGIYSVMRRTLNQPMYLLANNIGNVFHRRIAGDRNYGSNRLWREFNFILLVMGLVMLPVAFVVLLFGEQLFSFVFTDQFVGAALFAQIFLPALFMRMLAAPVAYVYMVFNHQRDMTLLQFLHIGLIVLAYIIVSPKGSVEWALAFHVVGSCIVYGLVIWRAKKIVATQF